METLFPFGFPAATGFYLSLYVLTLVVHVIFMNYVLAGTAYLAVVHFFPGRKNPERHKDPVADVLRDWMPFALGATITAGVAPLLFVQILYKEHFYTANLLLFHRWMAILPVLIAGFYFLYLLKTPWMKNANPAWVGVVALLAWLCFGFTGYSWTENHLLSAQPAVWPAFFGSDAIFFRDPELLPRLSVWFLGAIPNMALLVGWQLYLRETPGISRETRRLASIGLVGLFMSAIAVTGYFWVLARSGRLHTIWRLAGPYFLLALAGSGVHTASWIGVWIRRALTTPLLGLASAGMLATILGMTVVREALRMSRLNMDALFELHKRAASVGGLSVFLIFLALNIALIARSILVVRRGTPSTPSS